MISRLKYLMLVVFVISPVVANAGWRYSLEQEDWGASCYLSFTGGPPEVQFMSSRGDGKLVMIFDDGTDMEKSYGGDPTISILIDRTPYNLRFSPGEALPGYTSYDVDRRFLSRLAKGRMMEIRAPKSRTYKIDLNGSSAAMGRFLACAY